jgi:hypothetical protein
LDVTQTKGLRLAAPVQEADGFPVMKAGIDLTGNFQIKK